MQRLSLCLILFLASFATYAADKVKGMNFLVVDNQSWVTGEGTGYWILNSKGISYTMEGPTETTPVECHGAGYWDKEGSWGEGICVHGDGDDTLTGSWKREKGEEVGQWEWMMGTGKFEGASGAGTYKPTYLPGGRLMTEWEGETTLAE